MIVTFEAAAVAVFALLPGALYFWGFERQVGSWGVGFGDRMFAFMGVSAFIQVGLAPLTNRAWSTVLAGGELGPELAVAPWTWVALLAYVAAPFLAGSYVGRATRHRRTWAKVFTDRFRLHARGTISSPAGPTAG